MMSPSTAYFKVEGDMSLLIDPERVMEDTFIERLIKPHSDVREMACLVMKEAIRPPKGRALVKCGNSTYGDLLKAVKEKVDLNRVGVNVTTIKKTARGDLILEVDGDVRRKADVLKEAISKTINNDVKVANKMTTTHILDIDVTTTKEEVEKVISRG
ncbi:hypothetical protein QE152_g73 [Popillia japonica]|uniref:K Homology domain-containing protein n=1 Tax=Popillia japonica TaxID=7064 RepID=A0AAW1NCX4_POPJA